jgi:hypothetical protein
LPECLVRSDYGFHPLSDSRGAKRVENEKSTWEACPRPRKLEKERSPGRTAWAPFLTGTPGGIRTPDLRIRSPLLYPTELQALERSGRVSDFSKMSIMLSEQAAFASTVPQPLLLATEKKLHTGQSC